MTKMWKARTQGTAKPRASLPASVCGCTRASMLLAFATASMMAAVAADPDDDSITELIGSQVACAVVGATRANMPVEPLYTLATGQCEAMGAGTTDAVEHYADAQCTMPVRFEPTSLQDWCAQAVDETTLGSGADIDPVPTWTLTPGNRVDVGARSLEGVLQPYLQRRVFRQVDSAAGSCNLEMRVYARHPGVQGQHSLLALHGGSWSSRSFGFFGLEFSVAHFVEQGFVVYAPFYRLLGDDGGPAACSNATLAEIVEDAGAALDWVEQNAGEFGSGGKPVLFGQSAGAQLAASLAINHPASVAGAVLYYAPVDFEDFLLRAKTGAYTDAQGLRILDTLLGTTAELADVSASPVPENSFPSQVATDPDSVPPLFLLHGAADTLVEDRQSVRLCDALAGRSPAEADQPVAAPDGLRSVLACSPQALEVPGITASGPVLSPVSRLHRIREGEHALDLCLAGTVVPVDTCRSGSDSSRELVSNSIGQSVDFAVQAATAANPVNSLPDSPVGLPGVSPPAEPDAAPSSESGDSGGTTSSDIVSDSSGGGAPLVLLPPLAMWLVGRRALQPSLRSACND